ncbi:MAG: zinc metallopeptidase [Oscillospiraceae bacterium]|nr:zinc metallopeptidase [Oscillospiraceae bacterium]
MDLFVFLLILLGIPLLICFFSHIEVYGKYDQYNKIDNFAGLTAEEYARWILDYNGLYHVTIASVEGNTGDGMVLDNLVNEFAKDTFHDRYDPFNQVVLLSDQVRQSTSLSAIAVATHQCGHAMQHANNVFIYALRTNVAPVLNFFCKNWHHFFYLGFFLWLFVIYLEESEGMLPNFSNLVFAMMLFMFPIAFICQLIFLPMELDASKRAEQALVVQGELEQSELVNVRKILKTAAMTELSEVSLTLVNLFILFRNIRRR